MQMPSVSWLYFTQYIFSSQEYSLELFCFFSALSRFIEKGNLEVLLFTIQSKMRANNQKPYTPKEGKLIHDINKVAYSALNEYSLFLQYLHCNYRSIHNILQQRCMFVPNGHEINPSIMCS